MDIALNGILKRYSLDQIAVIDISHAILEKGKGIIYTPKKALEATPKL